ncbi:MAG: hypothetical protein WCJ40_09340 [Planctomycetota bacterium]|nr:MAG: hypothetical protein DWH73_02915 [Planctomycetota bacterium]
MTEAQSRDKPKDERIRKMVILWEIITLSGISIITVFIIWHLRRRAEIVKSNVRPTSIKNTGLELQADLQTQQPSKKDL